MPFLRVLSYQQTAQEIAERLASGRREADPLAPWSEEVLVPSRGVAEGITAALLERFPGGIAGLRIQTLDALARRIVNEAGETPRVATADERRLVMRTVARSLPSPLGESRGVAAMLERSYRDIRDSGLTLAELANRLRKVRVRNLRRLESVLRAWQEAERLVERLNAVDPADLLLRAAQLIGRETRVQIVAGFYDATGSQRAMLEALIRAGRVAGAWAPTAEPFAAPLLEVLESAGLERETGANAPHTATASSIRHDTRADEMASVCRQVAALLAAGAAPSTIGITARSLEPYDARLLNRFAEQHGFRTTLGEPVPLRAQRLGRGAMTLLRLRDRNFPRAEVLELVRDGLRPKTRIRPDAADAATRRARIAGGTHAELRSLSGRSGPVDDYLSLVAELEEMTANPAETLQRMASLFHMETETDLEAAAALDDIAALFRRVSIWNRPFDLPSVLDAIEQRAISSRAPAEGMPMVWAGDVLRFRGRWFEHTFVIRMEDDVFPQRRLEDPLLPDSDRAALGMREIGDGAAEEQLLLSLIRTGTSSEVHFSHAGGDGFGKVRHESRFSRHVPRTEPAPAPAAALTRTGLERRLQLIALRGRGGVFDGSIGAIGETLVAKLASLSPTQLEDFGECPQKFLLKHVLGAEDLEHPERELQINHRDKGSILHRVLEQFYRGCSGADLEAAILGLPRLSPHLAERIEQLVDEQFQAHDAGAPAFNPAVRAIEQRATKRLLRDFLVRDLTALGATGLRPRFFEYRFGTKHRTTPDHPEPFRVRTGGAEVRVEGTIDRVDSDGTRLRIIDYKSGKANRHLGLTAKIDRGIRLQLALYAMAASEIFGTEAASVSGAIRPISGGDERKFEFELAEKHDRLMETLEIFLSSIRNGVFPAYPDDSDDVSSCKYCPASQSCRTRHDPDERIALGRFKDARSLLEGRQP